MDADILNNIRNIALQEAQDQNYLAWYKSLCRWFSEKFSTPLKEVEGYAEEYVFQRYYEDRFWALATGDDKQRQVLETLIAQVLAEDHPEFRADSKAAAADDDEWYRQELAKYDSQEKKDPSVNEVTADMLSRSGLADPDMVEREISKTVQAEDPIPEDI